MRSQKLLDIWKGEYRLFLNFEMNGHSVTLGFPLKSSGLEMVWVKIDGKTGYVSISDALSFLNDTYRAKIITLLPDYSVAPKMISAPKHLSRAGTCIRCGTSIEHNLSKPLCGSCYSTWAVWKNGDYSENFCHTCGEPASTSYNKPECWSCYRNR